MAYKNFKRRANLLHLFVFLTAVLLYAIPSSGQTTPKITELVLSPNQFYAGSGIEYFTFKFTLNDNTITGGLLELHFPKEADKTIGAVEDIISKQFTFAGPTGSEGRLKPHSYTKTKGDANENVLFFRVEGSGSLPTGQYTIQFPQYGITTGNQQDGAPDPSVYQLTFLHESERDKPASAPITILPGKIEIFPNQAANNELIGVQIRLTMAVLDKDQESEIVIPKNREWKITFPPEFTFIGGLRTTTLQRLVPNPNPPDPFTIVRTEGQTVVFKSKSDATLPWGVSYDFIIQPNTVQITAAPETRAVSIRWRSVDNNPIGEIAFSISATATPRSGTLTVTPSAMSTGERIPKTLKLVIKQQNGPAIPFNTNFAIAFGNALTIADGLLEKVTISVSAPFTKTSVSGNTLSFITKAQETLLVNTLYEITVESGSYTGGQVGTQPVQWKLGEEVIGRAEVTVTPGFLYISPPVVSKNQVASVTLDLRLLAGNPLPAGSQSWVLFAPQPDFEFVQPITVSIGSCSNLPPQTPCPDVPFIYFLQTVGIVFTHTADFPRNALYEVTISGVKAVGNPSLTEPHLLKWEKSDGSVLVGQSELFIGGKFVRVVPSVTAAKIGEQVKLDIDVFDENVLLTNKFPPKRFEFDNTNARTRPKILDKSIIKTTGTTGKYTVTFTFQDNLSDTEDGPGTYTFKAVFDDSDADLAGTSGPVTVSAVITGNHAPVASFSTAVGATPLTINFDARASYDLDTCSGGDSAGTCLTYLWNFGDGQSSTQQNPTHVYSQSGTYTVSLQVTDKDAAPLSHTTSKTVTVGQPVKPGPATVAPVGDWPFDTSAISGDTVKDSSTSGNNGAKQGGVALQSACAVKECLKFDGKDGTAVTVPNHSALNFNATASFTLSAWINTTASTTNQRVVINKIDASGKGYALFTAGQSPSKLDVLLSGSSLQATIDKPINDGKWHYIAIVVDRGAQTMRSFIDGKLQKWGNPSATDVSIAAIGDLTNTSSLKIGANSANQTVWDGLIDEVKIFNIALTEQEVLGLLAESTVATRAGEACTQNSDCAISPNLECRKAANGHKCIPKPNVKKIGTWCDAAEHCNTQEGILKLTCNRDKNMCVGASSGISCAEDDVNKDPLLGAVNQDIEPADRCDRNSLFCNSNFLCQADLGATVAGQIAGVGRGTEDIRDTIRKVINIALGFLGVLGVIITLYGGWVWMTAMGEEEKVERAKKTIIAGLAGMVIIGVSWTIVTFVLNATQKATG